jgi:MoaA/NifB/PqqE/SkfB family radical SAM enzyme
MHCPHCGYSCSAKGKDISIQTIYNIISLIKDIDEQFIVIGGGEPTIHPNLWEILGLLFSTRNECSEESSIFIITNGKETETVKSLIYLGLSCAIGLELSTDKYHSPIDKEIKDLFAKYSKQSERDRRRCLGERDVARFNTLIPAGRAKNLAVSFSEESCICDDIFITPEGDVKICGCEDSPIIGNVNNEKIGVLTKNICLVRDYLSEKLSRPCCKSYKEKEFKNWIKKTSSDKDI